MKRTVRLLIGILVSLFFLYLVVPGLHLSEVWQTMGRANYWWIVPGVAVYMVGLWARTWRWHYMLRHLKRVDLVRLFPVVCIGFFGNSRRSGNFKMPHFQVVLGGMWRENAGSYGLAVGAVPSKTVPEVVDTITSKYVEERGKGETFQEWIGRIGKKEARGLIQPFMQLPDFEQQPDYFSDWGDPRVFSLGDIGIGECAGEVVSLFSMEIATAESEAFEAQVALDESDPARADSLAYSSMVKAARALVRTQFLDVGDSPDRIVEEFKTRFFDTELFFDQYAKGKPYGLARVADYKHIIDGPAILLVGHEADYVVDLTGGKPGLQYVRKRDLGADLPEALTTTLAQALNGIKLAETDVELQGKLKLRTDAATIVLLDRLNYPNRSPNGSGAGDAGEAVRSQLADSLTALFGGDTTITRVENDAREPLTFELNAPSAPDVDTLLGRL